MARLGTALLKGAGVLLLALIVLSVIATIVSIALSVVATVVAAVVTLAVLAVFVLALVGLGSLLRGDDADRDATRSGIHAANADDRTARSVEPSADPTDRLRSQYVAGKLDDDEFERELNRVLESDDIDRADRLESDRSRATEGDRSRLWDR